MKKLNKLVVVSRAADKAAVALLDRDNAIRAAHEGGHPMRDIATACGLSHQRVHQIIHRL